MVNSIFGRGTVTMVDDGYPLQLVQVASGNEVLDDLCRIQNYGLTAVPPVGAKALVLFAGSREDAVVTHADGPGRPNLEAGDVALYTDQGDSVVLKRGHHIALSTKAIAIKNSEGELISLLVKLLELLPQGRVGNAPVQYDPASFLLLKTKLESFVVKDP